MRCILCDRCKKIVEDERKIRVVTLAKPLTRSCPDVPPAAHRGDDRKMNDIMWTKELCVSCVEELDMFMEPAGESEPIEPSEPSEPSE